MPSPDLKLCKSPKGNSINYLLLFFFAYEIIQVYRYFRVIMYDWSIKVFITHCTIYHTWVRYQQGELTSINLQFLHRSNIYNHFLLYIGLKPAPLLEHECRQYIQKSNSSSPRPTCVPGIVQRQYITLTPQTTAVLGCFFFPHALLVQF